MDAQIGRKDKLIIYFRTAVKIIRGGGSEGSSLNKPKVCFLLVRACRFPTESTLHVGRM